MPPRILIPVDESLTSQHTIDALLANKDLLEQPFLLLHVVDVHLAQRLVPEIQKTLVYESSEKLGHRILEQLAKPFREAGLDPQLHLELGTPGEAILKVIKERKIELVVIGRHPGGGGLRDILFGSVANQVIREVSCPILLI